MLHGAFRRCIRKGCHIMILQRNPLDLHKGFSPGSTLNIKVKSGMTESRFRSYQAYILIQSAACKPFSHHLIGGIGIHIDQAAAFIHHHKIIGCGTGRIITGLQIYPGIVL